jgi:hypothetical protein
LSEEDEWFLPPLPSFLQPPQWVRGRGQLWHRSHPQVKGAGAEGHVPEDARFIFLNFILLAELEEFEQVVKSVQRQELEMLLRGF